MTTQMQAAPPSVPGRGLSPTARVEELRRAMPAKGLFAGKDWLFSPDPFLLSRRQVEELERLGHQLALFTRACETLYHQSLRGDAPGWVAALVDAGKPDWLLEAGRAPQRRNEIPRVLRPDFMLTDEGYCAAELDSIPGGIGLTDWFNKAYGKLGEQIVGGVDGMREGFRSLLPDGGDVLISEEAGEYLPEMEWLCEEMNHTSKAGHWQVRRAEKGADPKRPSYRFFELFDLPNLPAAVGHIEQWAAGSAEMTPPPKPQLEEKLWLALFWSAPLRDWWTEHLRASNRKALEAVFPFSWVLDPTPLPPHAVLPRLEVQSWDAVGEFSQKQRQLVLKISGFSELAWGSRSVVIGHDVAQQTWREALHSALESFPTSPYILQEFRSARVVRHRYVDPETHSVKTMEGRVRLTPYYFLGKEDDDTPRLGGALATICPADKKILHGMRDAIIVPCALAPEHALA